MRKGEFRIGQVDDTTRKALGVVSDDAGARLVFITYEVITGIGMEPFLDNPNIIELASNRPAPAGWESRIIEVIRENA